MKRQRGRNRGSNGGGGGNGGKPQHNVNRAFESNGPDNVKIRGNAQHVFEKYQQLARDSSASGDRVLAENYLQHAEHYFRVLRAVQPQRPASEIIGRDAFASGFDIDFEDDGGSSSDDSGADESGGEAEAAESQRQDRDWQGRREERTFNRDDRFREDRQAREERPREERPRDDRPRDDRQQQQRDERPRDERPRDERPRDERPKDERPKDERPREERQGRRDRYGRERYDRDRNRDPLAVVEPESTPLTTPAVAAAEPEEAPRQLRSQDGALSPAPAFLNAARAPETPAAAEGEPRRPRRRRAPRSFEGGEGEAPAPTETEEA